MKILKIGNIFTITIHYNTTKRIFEKGVRWMFSHKNSKGVEYWLHTREVKLRGGKIQRIFFFSKDSANSIDMPEGYKVIESKKTGLPLLKKI